MVQQQVPQPLGADQIPEQRAALQQQPVARAWTSPQRPLSSPLRPQLPAQLIPENAYAPIQRENYRWSSNGSFFFFGQHFVCIVSKNFLYFFFFFLFFFF